MDIVAGDKNACFCLFPDKRDQNQGVVPTGRARYLDNAGGGQDFLNLFQDFTPFC